MNQTRIEYIAEQQRELETEGFKPYEIKEINFDNEYYELIENYIKQGNTITNEIYTSLTQGQQYHFNKHYNSRGDKISNSDYSKAVEATEKQTEIDFNKYLEEQQQKQLEKDLAEQKENKNTVKRLNEEIEQLQNNLFPYDKLSVIGKRNINRVDHEQKQKEINQKITELKEQIKRLN